MEVRINYESWNDSLNKNVLQLKCWSFFNLALSADRFRQHLFNYHHCYTSYMKESYKRKMIKEYGWFRILLDNAVIVSINIFAYCQNIATFMEMVIANV